MPHLVCGDLDSARPEVCRFFSNEGCSLKHITDQDTTDFMKVMLQTTEQLTLLPEQHVCYLSIKGYSCSQASVYVLGGFGGRFDHVLANINVAHNTKFQQFHITFVNNGNITAVLCPGRHIFQFPTQNHICGLIPVAGPVTVSTKGLKWDVSDCTLSMTGMISTSNQIIQNVVEICCTGHVLFTVELTI